MWGRLFQTYTMIITVGTLFSYFVLKIFSYTPTITMIATLLKETPNKKSVFENIYFIVSQHESN